MNIDGPRELKNSSDSRGEAERLRPAQVLKFVAFSMILAVLGLLLLEAGIRVGGYDEPQLKTPLVPLVARSFRDVHRSDDLLFWALRPNFVGAFWGAPITTNSLGLRSREVFPKEAGEFRILCLGESSTFGAGVRDEETYCAVLERGLRDMDTSRKYTVINAGVSAYSSFQSMLYLEKHGFELEPDMVIIYHELADFMPTTNRDGVAPDLRGLPLSDQQLYESNRHILSRRLMRASALYRFISHTAARRKLEDLQTHDGSDGAVGAKHVVVPNLNDISTPDGYRELKLPQRVTLEEREANLNRMQLLCEDHGVQFVVIHPSYGESKRHECDLTEYCARHGVPMFDAHDSLHPEGSPMEDLYVDLWHPNAVGQRNLGQNLLAYLVESYLIPMEGER